MASNDTAQLAKADNKPKSKDWNWHPELPLKLGPPWFVWPLQPLKTLKWVWNNYLRFSDRSLILVYSLVIAFWLQPVGQVQAELGWEWVCLLVIRNYLAFLFVAMVLHKWFYGTDGQGEMLRYAHRPYSTKKSALFKFDSQIKDNAYYSLVFGVPIASAFEIIARMAYANGLMPESTFADNPVWYLLMFPIVAVWQSFHFYFVHRVLHWKPLYKHIHSIHHRNVYPGPWSGLSMHPVEHILYFTTPVIFLILPSDPVHMVFLMNWQLMGVVSGHSGYEAMWIKDKARIEMDSFFHQLHHRYFECNYGSGEVPWDKWLGTMHDGTSEGTRLANKRKKSKYVLSFLSMTLDQKYPCIDDLERAAQRRIPHFAWEYLSGGIGREAGLKSNRQALDNVHLMPRYLPEEAANTPDMTAHLLGRDYALPFGISPLGLSGLIWPGAVDILARSAAQASIPMGLSQFATTHMKDFAAKADDNGWYQYYPLAKPDMQEQMLADVAATGIETLIVTVDIPSVTRRDRELRVGLSVPPKITPRTVWETLIHPNWALTTLFVGTPKFQNMLPYAPKTSSLAEEAQFMTEAIEGHTTPHRLRTIRDIWQGKLLVKGIMGVEDAQTALDCGADGVWLSNHGARQLDACRSTAEIVPHMRAVLGPDVPIIVDSGPRTGLDIARMLALGANFVMLGRAFIFAVAALGSRGGDHAVHILREELRCAMAQTGARNVAELPDFLETLSR